jgi:hypothetical protein
LSFFNGFFVIYSIAIFKVIIFIHCIQKSGEESEVLVADKNKKVINKKTEKEDTVNENDNFKYSDAIDYKKAIKEGPSDSSPDFCCVTL